MLTTCLCCTAAHGYQLDTRKHVQSFIIIQSITYSHVPTQHRRAGRPPTSDKTKQTPLKDGRKIKRNLLETPLERMAARFRPTNHLFLFTPPLCQSPPHNDDVCLMWTAWPTDVQPPSLPPSLYFSSSNSAPRQHSFLQQLRPTTINFSSFTFFLKKKNFMLYNFSQTYLISKYFKTF